MIQAENKIRHLPYLDGLRAVAALYVVLHHVMLTVDRHAVGSLSLFTQNLFGFGRYGVDLFIVLSGFCLMLPVTRSNGILKGGFTEYLKRRAWRILPSYYFALGFSLLLGYFLIELKTKTQWDDSLPITLKSIVSHLFLTHDITGEPYKINYVFWSIAVEWRMYFLFPLLLLLWKKLTGWQFVLGSFIGSYFLFKVLEHTIGTTWTVDFIGLFAFGMYGAHAAFSKTTNRSKTELAWGIILAVMSVLVYLVSAVPFWKGKMAPEEICDYTFGFWSLALLIFISVNEKNWIRRVLSHKSLVFVGTFSYSLYLLHAPLLQVFWQYLFAPLQHKPYAMLFALIVIATPLIIAFSYFFYLWCEKPFIGRGKSKKPVDRLTFYIANQRRKEAVS